MTDDKEKLAADRAAFLIEYEALCRKYNLSVNSCGCCDSPWLDRPSVGVFDTIEESIQHLKERS